MLVAGLHTATGEPWPSMMALSRGMNKDGKCKWDIVALATSVCWYAVGWSNAAIGPFLTGRDGQDSLTFFACGISDTTRLMGTTGG